jgi:hypothetical protein
MTSVGWRVGAFPESFSITSTVAPRLKSRYGKIAGFLTTSHFDPGRQ